MGFKRKCYLVAKVQKKKETAKHFPLKLREKSYTSFPCVTHEGLSGVMGKRTLCARAVLGNRKK